MDIYQLPNITEPQPAPFFMSLPSIVSVITLTVCFSGFVYWCVHDYRFFKSLGPGGPPYNVYGWIKISFFVRPFTLADHDTTWTGDYPDVGAHKEIIALPDRKGGRPKIMGIAPQRQFSQCPGPEMNTVSSKTSCRRTPNPSNLPASAQITRLVSNIQ